MESEKGRIQLARTRTVHNATLVFWLLSRQKLSLHHNFSLRYLRTKSVHGSLFYSFSFCTLHRHLVLATLSGFISALTLSTVKTLHALRGGLFSVLGHLAALTYNLFRKKKKSAVDMSEHKVKTESAAIKSSKKKLSIYLALS